MASGTRARRKKRAAQSHLTRAVGLASALAAGTGTAYAAPARKPEPRPSNHLQSTPLLLPSVTVEGQSDGYKADVAKVERVVAPITNTPQVVVVVPEQVLEEQRATTVREAMRNVSGITMSAGEGGRQGDTFILRGFSGQNDVFRDGSRDLGWMTRDTFNLEGVEVYFGPSSVLFGRGSTGGAINLVTKSAKRGTFAEATVSGASAPQGRIEADVNHAVSDRVRMRVNTMGQMGRVAGRDVVEENRAGVAPSLHLGLGVRTGVDIDYLYQRERGIPDYGQPFWNGAPVSKSLGVSRKTFYGVERADEEKVDAHVATARIAHRFNNGFRLTNSLRFGVVDRFARPTSPSLTAGAQPGPVSLNRFETETDNFNVINQTDLRMTFETWVLQHATNVGIEFSRERRKQNRSNLPVGNANLTTDLMNPNNSPDLSGVVRTFSSLTKSTMLSASAYIADQIKIGRYVEVLGSVRLDSFDTDHSALNAMFVSSKLDKRDTLLNWRGGVVVHPVEDTSVYAAVGSSSNPSAEAGTLSDATANLDPEKNQIAEAGVKADLLEKLVSVGGSAFQIEKSNARIPNPDPTGPPQILEGRQRVRGLSFGGSGTIVDRWKVFANYTFMKSRIKRHSNMYLLGQALPSTPEHSMSLWTTLRLWEGFSVGGGAVYQAETAVNNPTAATQQLNKVPSFVRIDAFASQALKKVDLQLNLSNLTNALYYDQAAGSRAVPARGMVAMLSTRVRY